jgi:hypothetical protein
VHRCPQCSGATEPLSCEELFDRLLVLDHQQKPPWGALHAVVVACFFLQHPGHGRAPASGGDVQWAILQHYLVGGPSAVDAFVARARSANSHRRAGRRGAPSLTTAEDPRLPDVAAPQRFGTTIADVAVDGSFPAVRYEDRVRAWAHSTARAYGSTFP